MTDYLSGPYAPVLDEVTAFDLPVTGTLPPDLVGRYLRNGPNPHNPESLDPRTHHWFLGDGMVHGISIGDGKARWYRNRYVGSSAMSAARGLPDVDGPEWTGSTLGPNTSVGGFAGTTWAMMESGACPVELTYELETVCRNDFYGTLPGGFTAHPKLDPVTGELHAIAYAWAQWLDHVQYIIVGTDGRVRHTLDVPLPGMTMLHDMSLTERWVVVYDQPCTVDIELALSGSGFPFRWNPQYGNRIGLLPRRGPQGSDATAADIVWIDVPLGYVYHPMNAYDRPDGSVVIDVCRYDSMFDYDTVGPLGDGASALTRYELNPTHRTCAVTVIDETPNEFPTHRSSVGLQDYRFGYCSAATSDAGDGWPTLKHDLRTGERRVFDHGPGRIAGEPIFVPRSDDAEDDGWLMTFVHDVGAGTAEFVVLDAQEFDRRGYVATVTLPQQVPLGFHGNWVSDTAVAPG